MKKLIFLLLLITLSALAYSHSGRTNSSGCHNKTSDGTYHCHMPITN